MISPLAATRFACRLLVAAIGTALLGNLHAVVLPPADSSLETWVTQRVASRPGLPPEETRSVRRGVMPDDPAAATWMLMDAQVTGARARALSVATPRALAQAPEDHVYATAFTAGDGSRQEFAAHFRPDDSRPLYLRASGYAPVAGASFEQARAALIERVLGGATEGLSISGRKELVDTSALVLRNWRGTVASPWSSCWLFFVDDHPTADWEHPCRYVFLAPDLSAFAVQYDRSILELFNQTQPDVPRELLSLVVAHPVSDAPRAARLPVTGDGGAQSLNLAGSARNCYAVILSGGANAFNNWQRYWEDSANIYSTLRYKYGFTDDHIIALISDGTNAANDRNIGTKDDPVYANSPTDLDGDGDVDTDGPCTLAEVQAAFDDLAGILTANDQLFVFITDHGYQESGHDAGVCLWGDNLRDDQLADMTQDLPCPVMFALETCYSGGFEEDIIATANRVIGAAAEYDDTSEGWWHYDPWVYYFTAAVRGYYPKDYPAKPWEDDTACNVDGNGDNRISFNEAWTHAWNNRPASDIPQLGENPAGLGNSLFMNQLHIELANNSPLAYSEIPKDFSFQVVSSGWAAVGVAPATSDHDIKADNNRQLTSPYRTSVFGGTTRDFIVANGHLLGNVTHYAQVYVGTPSAYHVEAEWLPSDAALGSTLNYTASANEVFDVIESYLTAGTSYDLQLNVTSGSPDLGVYVFSPSSSSGSRSSANWSRNSAGAGGDETLTFRPTVTGWHGIVMVNETGGSGNYTVTVTESPPLAAPTGVAATDGSYADRIRVTWNSVSGATHYTVYRSTVNNSGTATALNDWTAGTTYDDLTATGGRTYYYWVKSAATVAGDRESTFSTFAGGYVLPTTLVSDAKVTASADPTYYRAGGEAGCNWWWAVGVRADTPSDNWSLKLYDGPGFGTLLETSAWATPVDFVVVDGNHIGATYRGVEAYQVTGSGTAAVEFEGTGQTLAIGAASFVWTGGDVVEMWDVTLTNNTTYRFTLDITNGTNDLGFAIFSSGDGDYQRAREHYAARADAGGAGVDESFTFTATATDSYGLCVWANGTSAANYTLRVEALAAGLWEGDVSSNWHTPGNWNDGYVPDATDDVTIPTGAPRFPLISATNAVCHRLTIGPRASLSVSNRLLTIVTDLENHGHLTLSNSTACKLTVSGDVYWEEASTCTVAGDAEMYISGDWNFEEGANVKLTSGYVEFQGAGDSWIRVYDGDCRFYNVRCDKSGGGVVRLSPLCVAPIHLNNLYQYSASSLYGHTDQPLVLGGFFNNLGGHFRFYDGALVYAGSPSVGLKPNTNDFLNDLIISGTGSLTLDATYTNALPIRGSVAIASGGLNASSMDLLVGGSWTNEAGAGAFVPGVHKVTFNGVGTQQRIEGTNVFYDLVDARSGGDQLLLKGTTTVQHDFAVNYQTAVWAPLVVQNTIDLSNPSGQLILWGAADVQAAKIYLTGDLLVYSGSLVVADLLNNGLYGYIDIQGGEVSLTQGTGLGQYFDLYGTLKMTGGRLDLYGGAGDHYWPVSGNTCTFVMNGGVLDFHNQGWRILNGFSGGITNGTLRCAENVLADTPAFAPVGGLLELYGSANAQLRQATGSTFPDVLVNKGRGAQAEATTNLTIKGSVEIRAGVLKAGTNMLTVSGNWTNGVGSAGFSEDTSTVRFVGSAAADIQSDETFYRLELNKTYAALDGLEVANTVHVLNDLVLTDGTLKLDGGSVLDVDRDVLIANGAGLNAKDRGGVEIHVGRHWSNLNTGFADTYGFNCGYDSLVVFDGGAVSGDLGTAAAQETFGAVRIDRPSGTLRVLDALLLRDNLTILNGSLSYSGGPFSHRLRGDLTIETGGAWFDTVSTVIFDGTKTQNLNHKSMNGWFKHLVVEKNTGILIYPLTLQTNVLLLGGGTLTVREGYMNLNGHYVRCTGNVTVENGGTLQIDAGAWVEVGDPGTLEVQPGGTLDVRGAEANPASVKNWSGPYAFLVQSNGVIRAQNAVFQGMNTNGLWVTPGAVVDEPFTFHGCTFRNGVLGGTLLRLENKQALTIRNAVFPTNAGRGSSNVTKSSATGRADFVHATGVFAGESYDDDTFNLINWHTGVASAVHLSGPTFATMGGQYDYTATVTGDVPLTPITYTWTITDQSPMVHLVNDVVDSALDRQWTTAGTKSVQVIISNILGTAQANLSVDVQALDLAVLGRQWVGPTNAVNLLLKGTSASSTYQVQYRTNLNDGYWSNAIPDGASILGANGQTLWLDLGGPGRDVNTSTQMFYRVVMPTP